MSEPTPETLLIRRLTAALQDLIEGSSDPGSEALGAVWEGKHYRGRARASRPTRQALIKALAEIETESTSRTSLCQPGAAFALGLLAEAVDAHPGCTVEDIAFALLDPAETPDLRYVTVRVEDSDQLHEALGLMPGSLEWHRLIARVRELSAEFAEAGRDYNKVLAAQPTRVAELEGALTHILELIEYQDRPVAQIKVRARMALEGGKSGV